jgi:hypothetical protein
VFMSLRLCSQGHVMSWRRLCNSGSGGVVWERVFYMYSFMLAIFY